MIASAAVHKAIVTVWNASSLNWAFMQNWPISDQSRNSVLHENEAAPGQPFPFCVYEIKQPTVRTRMTSDVAQGRREIHDYPLMFNIHSSVLSGSGKSAKEIASELAEAVIQQFGGHPSSPAFDIASDVGNILQLQYQSDHCVRTGDEEYQWTIEYIVTLDTPVAE